MKVLKCYIPSNTAASAQPMAVAGTQEALNKYLFNKLIYERMKEEIRVFVFVTEKLCSSLLKPVSLQNWSLKKHRNIILYHKF